MSQKEGTANHFHMYEVSDVPNYENYKQCFGFIISEPRKYVATHVLIWVAALLFYIVTAFKTSIVLISLVVLFNILVEVFLLMLGFTDPGMIPKILSSYENKKFRRVPLD